MWWWRVLVPAAGVAVSLAVLGASLRPDEPGQTPGAGTATEGEAVAPRPARVLAEGRVAARPGAEITIGTEAGGLITRVAVRETSKVRKGDVLVELQPDLKQAALAEAEAQLAEADAELAFARGEYQRLARGAADSPQFAAQSNAARRDFAVAEARRREAAAVISAARADLARTRLVAPIDGVVTACFARPGEVAPPGARLVTVTDLARLRIEAEVDEFDAPRVAVGAAVTVTAEGFDDESWTGSVEEIPDRVASRTLRPDDPGRPTDTGVLLVKIALDRPTPLKLGQQVEVTIRQAEPKDEGAEDRSPSGGPSGNPTPK
jgi:RND family efflux transporter MFP subunit